MGKVTYLLIPVICLAAFAEAKSEPSRFTVRYLSAENVYLNGGSADGLTVGARLLVKKTTGCTTELEVVYAAEHSSSCTFTVDSCGVAIGDEAYPLTPFGADTLEAPDTTAPMISADTAGAKPSQSVSARIRRQPSRLSGNVAVGYYYLNDQSPSNLDFQQATGRLNLKARRLFDREITFNLRVRGRYDQRDRAYSSQVERDAWENRMWELSLTYDDPHAQFSGAVGRILSRRVATVGYVDGAVLERRIGSNTYVGLLAGSRPKWAYDKDALSLQKGAGYVTVISGELSGNYSEQTIAAIGEYHSGTVSRELLSLQGRINHSGKWGGYHAIEIDLNRGWRREKAGKSISLSSVYANTWLRLNKSARFTIGYDNRTNYWTYDLRSTIDSLFDDHLRQGIRSQVDLSLPKGIQISAGAGWRKRQGAANPTTSYLFNLGKSAVWNRTSRISGQYSAFNGSTEHGNHFSARVSDYLSPTIMLGLGLGGYSYKADAGLNHRTSKWYEVSSQIDLRRNWFLAISGQIDHGDDIDGLRLQSELGMRF